MKCKTVVCSSVGMKRKISCPIMFSNVTHENKADYLRMIEDAVATRVYIAVGRGFIP